MTDSTTPIPIIIDCDPGHDDMYVLALATATSRVDVRGITCAAGNLPLDEVVANTLGALEATEAGPIPVAAGRDHPLVRSYQTIEPHRRRLNIDLPIGDRRLEDVHAVELMARLLRETTEPITIIAIAPLTNVALLLRMYPELAPKIERIVAMGGAVDVPGNASPFAEFNIVFDPEAAHVVLMSGVKIVLYPLDVFYAPEIAVERYAELMLSDAPAARTVGRVAHPALVANEMTAGTIGDGGALCVALWPELARTESVAIEIVLEGEARGATNRSSDPSSSSVVEVVLGVDADAMIDRFITTVEASHTTSSALS